MFKVAIAAKSADLPRMDVPDTAAFLADVHASNDPEKTIVCGFFRMEAGKPLSYHYDYDEMKLIVEGEMVIAEETGQAHHARAGDVFYFAKGSDITFSSPTFGIGFFCGQRQWGTA